MKSFAPRITAFLGATALAFIALGLAATNQPARAATVSISVTCLNTLPEVPITAAQGDTVEVTIDSGCYGPVDNKAASGTPQTWRSTHFSSWPAQGVVANTVNKFTWVVATNAPIGTMAGVKTVLPYVCNNCLTGAFLRFTITAASTTTLAPATTVPATTTLAPTTTVPATTTLAPTTTVAATSTTEPRLVGTNATLPDTGAGSSQWILAVSFMGVGVLLLCTSRLRVRARKV